MALSLIDLFAEAVLRWSLRTDRPATELTMLVMLAVHGGHDGGRLSGGICGHDAEQMRVVLHDLADDPGLREDFLVRSLIREIDDVLDDQLENYGRNKARARERARKLEMILLSAERRDQYEREYGLTPHQADSLLGELRRLASTAGGLEELARRKRALDAWRDLSAPILAPDLLREWREARLTLRGETIVTSDD